VRPGLNTGLIMHRTQGDTSRAPRSAAEPQRDVWRGLVRTHLARPTPDEEGFRVADRSGPAASPARTRNTKSRRSAGKMKMFRGRRYRCAYLTSEAIERFALRFPTTSSIGRNPFGKTRQAGSFQSPSHNLAVMIKVKQREHQYLPHRHPSQDRMRQPIAI
jgi:hypothetical protein